MGDKHNTHHPPPRRGRYNEPSRPYGASHSWHSKPDQRDSEPKPIDKEERNDES